MSPLLTSILLRTALSLPIRNSGTNINRNDDRKKEAMRGERKGKEILSLLANSLVSQ